MQPASCSFLMVRGGFLHALQRVHVAGSLVVAQCERVALVHGVQSRIQLQVVMLAGIRRVRLVLHVRLVLVGIDILPGLGNNNSELVCSRRFHLFRLALVFLVRFVVGSGLGRTCNQPHDHTKRAQRCGPESEFVLLDLSHTNLLPLTDDLSSIKYTRFLNIKRASQDQLRGFYPAY